MHYVLCSRLRSDLVNRIRTVARQLARLPRRRRNGYAPRRPVLDSRGVHAAVVSCFRRECLIQYMFRPRTSRVFFVLGDCPRRSAHVQNLDKKDKDG